MFGLPIHATAGTMAVAAHRTALGKIERPCTFVAGDVLAFGDLRVETLATPHDGAEPASFIFDDGTRRLGILTDLGHVYDGLGDSVASLDAVILESNYDEQMLRDGPYPAFLKRRISGSGGHISNTEAADLLSRAADGLSWACLGHLSGENNTPQLAIAAHRNILGGSLPLHIASRESAGEFLTV